MEKVTKTPRVKNKCQIFTPDKLIDEMLKKSRFANKFYDKKVLENSCGDGRILVRIVEKYIKNCLDNKLKIDEIIRVLENNIVGYEIDREIKNKCLDRLNTIALSYGISNVNWNIKCKDFLVKRRTEEKFDYIIGNPPYIAYPDLPDCVKKTLRKNYYSCKKGKFDYYYAFIEKSYSLLTENGKLIYLVPSNFFKNAFAENLRNLIIRDLSEIVDYPNLKVFNEALVSPAIIIIEKNSNRTFIDYTNKHTSKPRKKRIEKTSFTSKWVFEKRSTNKKYRFGDFFQVSSAIATLSNKTFVLRDGFFDENHLYHYQEYQIEAGVLKRTTSPKSKKYNINNEYILFPYYYDESQRLVKYAEDEFRKLYPGAYKYLLNHKKDLLSRDSDDSAKWFEYGRSQALNNMNHFPMLLVSSIISSCTQAYILDNEIPYSGLYIIPNDNLTVHDGLQLLNSPEFKEYIMKIGVCVSGTSKRISPKDIEQYTFNGV